MNERNEKRMRTVLYLLVSLEQLMSLHEVLVFELLLKQLVLLLQMALFQLPHSSFSG